MAQRVSFWFRHRYRLPPTDPRFLDMTLEDMEAEYWAVHYFETKDDSSEEFEDDDFDEAAILAQIEADALEAEKRREAEQGPPDPGDWEPIE